MAITKILNIQESDGRNPASHLKNALEYIQNPDKTEECVLVGSINCLPDTAFEQMEETKNIFHKTGKRQVVDLRKYWQTTRVRLNLTRPRCQSLMQIMMILH